MSLEKIFSFLIFLVFFFVIFSSSAHANNTCSKVPLNDLDFLRPLAEQGNAQAQFEYGNLLDKEKTNLGDRKNSAVWWLKSSEQGYAEAQDQYCSYKIQGRNIQDNQEAFKWCRLAALQNNQEAQGGLAVFYILGEVVPQNYETSYFWMIAGDSNYSNDAGAFLTDEQKKKIKHQVLEWKKKFPEKTKVLPLINVQGLLCGGTSLGCKIEDSCGDQVAIVCPNNYSNFQQYFFGNKKNNNLVSACSKEKSLCNNYEEIGWNCPSPNNMPLSDSDRKKLSFSEQYSIVGCGKILGVTVAGMRDGPYNFVEKETATKLHTCSFWQGKCSLPEEWKCGFPSNYQ